MPGGAGPPGEIATGQLSQLPSFRKANPMRAGLQAIPASSTG
ncbi:hypothetical protein NSU_3775 [Novosphingobium pentaromativorans US6-1]|uniref:Uncharacterized protein n=1 Tax=Novosphingobium pentaromativorans US6-1 TaxID=1088721 RepID=G6EHF4_9SPHN|nr:hypothetical protein NSU_3775 [Novosphingobium pentaromativorans US6-1]